MSPEKVHLSHGLVNEGAIVDHLFLRGLNGHDEECLQDNQGLSLPSFTSAFLGGIVSHPDIEITGDTIRDLSIGDRTRLLLALRKNCMGDVLDCVLTCTNCQTDVSFEVPITMLLHGHRGKGKKEMDVDASTCRLRIRPLRGRDLEEALEEGASIEGLAKRCITSSDPPFNEPLTPETLNKLSEVLRLLDPLADVLLDMECPSCGERITLPFDVERIIYEELRYMYPQLEQEVHWLALYYHWELGTILSLPIQQRRRFVELINDTIGVDAT